MAYNKMFYWSACSKIKRTFCWSPVWHLETAMEKIVKWSVCYMKKGDLTKCMKNQI